MRPLVICVFAAALVGCAQIAGLDDYSPGVDSSGGGGGTSSTASGAGGTGGLGGAGGLGGSAGGEGPCRGQSYRELVMSHEPVAYWTFDDPPVDDSYLDVTAHGREAVTGSVAPTQVRGLISCGGNALDFAGSGGQELSVSTSLTELAFENAEDFSLEAWIESHSIANGFVFFKVQNSGAERRGYQLGFSAVDVFRFARFSDAQSGISSELEFDTTPTPNQVHHVVATFDGQVMRVYIDKALSGELSMDVLSLPASAVPLKIATNQLDGVLDELAVYNFPLSQTQIDAHYAAGTR